MRLVSGTIGVNRVVDERIMSFEHTSKVPWMLPGVQPTNKVVHIAGVSVVCLRGDKLHHERLYWDQASVLVQVGLLDLGLVPIPFREQGLQRIPVVASECAAKVLGEGSHDYNALFADTADEEPGWSSLPMRPKQAAHPGQTDGT